VDLAPDSEKNFFKFLLMQRVLHRTLRIQTEPSAVAPGQHPKTKAGLTPAQTRSGIFEF
jgi:hypothetical protein